MKIREVNPQNLKRAPDDELLNLHRRCHQLYPKIREQGGENINLEDVVNAHHLIVAEMARRSLQHHIRDELDKKLKDASNLPVDLDELPEKIILVPEFVDLVGSAVRRPNYDDIDILVRADLKGDSYQIKFESVYVPIRLTLTPDKEKPIHLINNPQGAFTNYVPIYDLALVRSDKRDVKIVNPFWKALDNLSELASKAKEKIPILRKEWGPITHFTPSKPRMGFYYAGTEAFKPEELITWLEKHPEAVAENKLNGFRAIIQKKGDKVSIFFEDAQKERKDQIPELIKAIQQIGADFILDGDVGLYRGDERLPRLNVMSLTADNPELPKDVYPVFTAFDILYWDRAGGDLRKKPLRERRQILERFHDQHLKNSKHFDISHQMKIRSLEDLAKAFQELGNYQLSEGIVLKDETAPYHEGPNDSTAKIKKVAELKAIVLEARKNKNGTYSFDCGLLPGELPFANVVEFRGKTYVNMKYTMNAPFKAKPGDIITVQPQEIMIRQTKDGDELSWTAAVPIDIDKERKEPYTAGQAVDLARRAGILNDTRIPAETKKQDPIVDDDLIQILLHSDWTKNKTKYNFLKEYEPTTKEMKIYKALYTSLYEQTPGDLEDMSQELKMIYALHGPLGIEELIKEDDGEEIDTRSEAAAEYWAENWYKEFPPSGKGQFVVQHHWRGLSEEDTKKSNEELLETDHSLHADLRFSVDDHLWGFTAFLGDTKENREAGGSLLYNLGNRKLQGAFKLPQPKEWLEVGKDEPLVVPPRDVGSTTHKWSKFFLIDSGTYEIGVWREHFFEIFLHGEKLTGRYLIEYAPVAGRRIWLLEKPEDQTPYAEKNRLEDVVKELKQKGQKWLVWAKPGEKPKLIDVTEWKPKDEEQGKEKRAEIYARIVKIDDEERFALAPALVPNRVDKHGDVISAEEIERTAHNFMANYQSVHFMHEAPLPRSDVTIVESYILRQPYELADGDELPPGTWMIGFKIHNPELWRMIKKGEIRGVSIGGICKSCPQAPDRMKTADDEPQDQEPQELRDLEVFEVSLVSNPAVPDARWVILKMDEEVNPMTKNIKEEKEEAEETGGSEDVLDLLVAARQAIDKAIAAVEAAVMGYSYAPPSETEKKENAIAKVVEQLQAIVDDENLPSEVRDAARQIIEYLRAQEERYPVPEPEKANEKPKDEEEKEEDTQKVKKGHEDADTFKKLAEIVSDKVTKEATETIREQIEEFAKRLEKVEEKFGGETTKKLKESSKKPKPDDFYSRLGRDKFGRKIKR